MNAPERIFAGRTITGTCVISFFTPSEHYSTEYIRADVAADMVATALREAAGILQNRANGARIAQWGAEERKYNEIAVAILALIPCKDTAELARVETEKE